MIIYVKNSKNQKQKQKNLLELISSYSKVEIQGQLAFLFSSNEQVDFEIKNTMLFTLVSPKVKYLSINLTNKIYMRKTTNSDK